MPLELHGGAGRGVTRTAEILLLEETAPAARALVRNAVLNMVVVLLVVSMRWRCFHHSDEQEWRGRV